MLSLKDSEIIRENPDCIWHVFNHNHTLLGVFRTQREAEEEAAYYTYMTGNAAYTTEHTGR